MKLTLDAEAYDELQRIFTAEFVERIKIKLQEAGFDEERLEDLTAEIALTVAGIVDDLAQVECAGVQVHPYLTFRTENDDLLHCGENAYTYEQVYGVMRKLFHSQ